MDKINGELKKIYNKVGYLRKNLPDEKVLKTLLSDLFVKKKWLQVFFFEWKTKGINSKDRSSKLLKK